MYDYSDEAKAIHAAIDAAREDAKKARQYLNQASTPTTVNKWKTRYSEAMDVIENGYAELRAGRRNELRELDDATLVRQLASAKNYSYEANMGDYSSGSISRAAESLDNVKAILRERGIDADLAVEWVTGSWKPVADLAVAR